MSDMAEKMESLVRMENPNVYSVSVTLKDHSTLYRASAILRGDRGYSYDATGQTAEEALYRLGNVLDSLVCPTCGVLHRDPQWLEKVER